MSSQPQRRLRPVVAPNSWPTRWIRSPISSASSDEGAAAHAGRVGLDDAHDRVDLGGPHPGAAAGVARHRVRGGDEGVGAVVHVEVAALGPFEEDLLFLPDRLVEQQRDVRRVRPQDVGVTHVLFEDGLCVDGLLAEELRQVKVLFLDVAPELLGEGVAVQQVANADADAGNLVLVCRTDAALGGPDLACALGRLSRRIHAAVVGHDQVRPVAEDQFRVGREGVFLLQVPDLLDEHLRVDDHAVAQHAHLVIVEDPRRDQVQDGLLSPDHDRVPRVVAALETHDGVGVFRIEVDDLALAFIAPLGPYDDHA